MMTLHLVPSPEERDKLRISKVTRTDKDRYSIHPYDGHVISARLPLYKVNQPTDFVALIQLITAAQVAPQS
jgi:hypothetical protein